MRRIHRPFKSGATRKNDTMRAKSGAGLLHQVFDVEMLSDLIDDPLSELGVSACIKRSPPKIGGDVTLVVGFGTAAHGRRERHQRDQVELPAEIAQDRGRDMGIVGQEAAVLAQDTELDGQAAEVLGTAVVRQDKGDVALRQRPVESQLFIRGMRRHEDGRTRRGVLQDAGSRGRLRGERH